jgi:Metal-dependent hydrolases of the beta-lactamase superfamily I
MNYNIISTGSKGNAVVLNNRLLIDCGVNYKQLSPYVSGLQLVLLTHIHGDHFYPSTIKKLAKMRPTLRFGCCDWLLKDLISCGVQKWRIDIFTPGLANIYNQDLQITAVELSHNVPNCGYKIFIDGEKIFYATDTNNLNGITAPDYDLYMIEANYEDEEIQERIRKKEESGQYAYEYEVLKNHLSKQKCDDFIVRNAGTKSKFIYMHGHIGKENDNGN